MEFGELVDDDSVHLFGEGVHRVMRAQAGFDMGYWNAALGGGDG